MNGLRKYFRLLPAVVIVGVSLLAIKGADLARAAQAPVTNSDTPDNSGLAPSDPPPARVATDFAAEDGTIASAAEVDVLTSLTRRRAELDARERALNMRENLLSAGEGRVDQKIAALKTLQTQIQDLLKQRDAAQDQQIASLVKTYSTMKAKDASRIFNTLSDDVLIPVAKGMKSDILAPILAAMNADAAQKLTIKLAALLKLPEPPPAADCPTVTPAAATGTVPPLPGTSAALTPAVTPPVQMATIAPPPVVTPAVTPPPATTPPPPVATTPPPPAAAPPAQTAAAPPPKPHKPAPHKPAKPTTAAAAPPAKPASAATAATALATPPAKPVTAPTPPANPASATTAATALATPPAKPVTAPAAPPGATPAASGPPAAIAPASPAGG